MIFIPYCVVESSGGRIGNVYTLSGVNTPPRPTTRLITDSTLSREVSVLKRTVKQLKVELSDALEMNSHLRQEVKKLHVKNR